MKPNLMAIAIGIGLLPLCCFTAAAAAEEPLKCQELRKEIELSIEGANRCTESSDCVIEYPGCPFGCAVPLNKENLASLRLQIADYAKQCELCEYKCARMPNGAVCEDRRCLHSKIE